MKVSVAMCTYNGERFLEEQLHSIAQQTYAPAELVVCDDGSTDGTAGLVEAFGRSVNFPVRWFRNRTNLGSTRNFAQAIGLCTGEAIALCDQDDRWMPEKLAASVSALQADPDLAGVFSNALLMDENSTPQPGDLWERMHFGAVAQDAFQKGGAHFLVRRDTVTGAAFVFRATMVDRVLPIPAEWVHDGWIALVLAALSKIEALPEHLMVYRLHHGQQVGATVVPLSAHLHTERDAALKFHHRMVRRWSLLSEHLDKLAGEGSTVDRAVCGEVQRKIRFEQARASLLERPRAERLFPAIAKLADYHRYEKGILSLFRDLTHAS